MSTVTCCEDINWVRRSEILLAAHLFWLVREQTVTDSEQRWMGKINHDGQERKGNGTGYNTVQLSETSENR